ncbi:MAG: hypothetical protein K9J13_13820 [Saprospiraceae bacterium]|nr:hypothetical protein [Saprospiraceae bacterium]
MHQKIISEGKDIRTIQFYNSERIILKRELDSTEIKILKGKVRYENGKYIEVIKVRKARPCICDEVINNQYIAVRFEEGKDKLLTFRENDSLNVFKLGAFEWKNNIGKIKYDNKVYYFLPPSSNAYLKIKKKDSGKSKRIRRLKGQKVK